MAVPELARLVIKMPSEPAVKTLNVSTVQQMGFGVRL